MSKHFQAFVVLLFLLILYGLSFSYLLNYFYLRGAAVYDAGWFAWLSQYSRDWLLPNPAAIGGNFLPIHASLIFLFTGALARIAPAMPYTVWFCIFQSIWLPLLWGALFRLMPATLTFWRRAGFAGLLAFNGITLSMFGFPHIESVIPALLLLALGLLLKPGGRGKLLAAALVFLVMLTVREDAGFHAGLLAAALFCCAAETAGTKRLRLLVFCLLGLLYSVTALVIQHVLGQGGDSLSRIYLGHPVLAQVTAKFLTHRLLYWATARSYLTAPIAILFIAGLWKRDLKLLTGVFIAIPWLILSLVAVSHMAGDLWGYYSFPIMVTLLWPLLLLNLASDRDQTKYLRLQLAMAGTSFCFFVLLGVLPGIGQGGAHDRAPWLHVIPPTPAEVVNTENALKKLSSAPDFSKAITDDGAASLLLQYLRPGQYSYQLNYVADGQTARYLIRFRLPLASSAVAETALTVQFPNCMPVRDTELEVCRHSGD